MMLTTTEQINVFRAKVILSAMKLYLKTGMKANRLYTPTNMRNAVSEMTGILYPNSRRGLEMAYGDLTELLSQVTTWRGSNNSLYLTTHFTEGYMTETKMTSYERMMKEVKEEYDKWVAEQQGKKIKVKDVLDNLGLKGN